MKLTLPTLTTALDLAAVVLGGAALLVLCVLLPAVGLPLLAAVTLLALSWAIEHLR